jgi:ribulose bisphosphate carboxylase small subunit
MKKYRVVWSIWLEAEIEANSKREAENWLANCDCQHDGSYVEDTFGPIKIEKIE